MAAEALTIDMSDLKDLEPLSKRLKTATNELNTALQSIQDRLNALGLGVEVWLNDRIAESSWRNEVFGDGHAHEGELTGNVEFYADKLGYGRYGDSWALLVRTERYVARSTEDSSPDIFEGDRVPLLRASRTTRAKSVRLIPKLIDAIKAQSEQLISDVEQAKKIADSLE